MEKIINSDIFKRGLILPDNSLHKIDHWERVEKYGLMISDVCKADKKVVSLFAYLHDARRINDSHDPEHGARAADLLTELLKAKIIELKNKQKNQLIEALTWHSFVSANSKDVTVQTCWDSDRLDLWRAQIEPDPKMMFTLFGSSKYMINFAKHLNNINE
ncbi:MAG: hypothetical protein WC280_01665 [Patescibacteria group bacterium]